MTQQPKKLSPLAAPKTRQKPAKRKPLGNPIEWSDQDLSDMAAISPADLKAAAALWQSEAPTPLKSLLQAKVEDK